MAKLRFIKTTLNAILLDLPWANIFTNTWKALSQFWQQRTSKSIYEVLVYEMELDLLDTKGKKANYRKRQRVRYLQNNVIAYHDQAWGDGQILLDFKCKPGHAVDRYRLGHKTLTLISIRQIRNRGDQDTLYIVWSMKNSFVTKVEEWTTSISHRTKKLKINISFPKKRPPLKLWLIETNRQKQTELGKDHLRQLPDGRWQVSWEKIKPRLYEDYTIRWQW